MVINPLLIANFAKLSLRKTKTDKKDAMTIAQFLLVHRDTISQLSLSRELQDFRDIARERESVCNMLSAHKVEVKRLLQSTFPELERIGNLSTRVMLDFIEAFPSARLVKMAGPKAIQKILQRKGVGTRLTYTAEDLIQAAKHSVATISPAKEFILQGKVRTLQHLQGRYEELTKMLTEYCKSSMLEDFEIITSIDGISKCTATTFLAEIGCIGNYASYKKLIAFAGIDPTVYQSGKNEKKKGTTNRKNGNKYLSWAYGEAAELARRSHWAARHYYNRKSEGRIHRLHTVRLRTNWRERGITSCGMEFRLCLRRHFREELGAAANLYTDWH